MTDTLDPNQQGRVKVSVPAVLDTVELWAMPCVPYAGDGVGFYAIPASGTGVWVEFEGGDPGFPIWTGCFWGSGQLPDEPLESVKVWRTGSLTIRLDDTTGELLVASDSGAQTIYTASAETSTAMATHTVSSTGITSAKGLGSVDVSDSGVSINNGSLEVT